MKHNEEDIDTHEMKEATQNVLVTLFLSLACTEKKQYDLKMTMAFKDVPVSVTDEKLKGSAVDELDKIYQGQKTLRLLDENDKPVLLDAEDIKSIVVTNFLIKRGE